MNVEMKCYIIPLPPDGALEVQQRRAPAKGSHSLQVAFQLLVNGYISSLFNSDHCHNSQAHVCHSNPPWTSRDEPAPASIVPLRPTTPVLSPLILSFIHPEIVQTENNCVQKLSPLGEKTHQK